MKKLTIFLAIFVLILAGCNGTNLAEPDVRKIDFSSEEGKTIKTQILAHENSTPDNYPKSTYKVGEKTIFSDNNSIYLLSDDGETIDILIQKPSENAGLYIEYSLAKLIDDNRFLYYYYETNRETPPVASGFGIYDISEMKDHPISWSETWHGIFNYSGLNTPDKTDDFIIWGNTDRGGGLKTDELHRVDLNTYKETLCKLKRPGAYRQTISPDGKFLVEESDYDDSTEHTIYISDLTTGDFVSFAIDKDKRFFNVLFAENRKFYLRSSSSDTETFTYCYEVTF